MANDRKQIEEAREALKLVRQQQIEEEKLNKAVSYRNQIYAKLGKQQKVSEETLAKLKVAEDTISKAIEKRMNLVKSERSLQTEISAIGGKIEKKQSTLNTKLSLQAQLEHDIAQKNKDSLGTLQKQVDAGQVHVNIADQLSGTMSDINAENLTQEDVAQKLLDLEEMKSEKVLDEAGNQRDLTQEELSQQLASGELQRMIGASRKEIVGGGVMTEQDALRIIEALGGNIDQLQDPERVKSAISQIFSEKYNKYEQNLRNYNIQVRNEYGTKGYKSKNPIKFTKEQLKRFDAGITTDLGLLSYDDLSNADLLAINPENLDDEKLKLYFDELEKRKL